MSSGNVWTAARVNAIYDHLQWWRDTRPVFRGQAWSNAGMSGIEISTATDTTMGFGTGGSFYTTPEINVGSWTVQGSDSDPESLVVPESGIYRVSVNVRWAAAASGERVARLIVNGSVENDIYSGLSYEAASFTAGNNCSGLIDVASGAQLDIGVWQNSGSTLDATATLHIDWVQST